MTNDKFQISNVKWFARLPIVASLLLIVISLPVLSAWQRQRTPSLSWLHSVFFVDSQHGWAAGSRGTLMATNDGGLSWQVTNHPTTDTIRDVYFTSAREGWLLCERNLYELKSNDEPRAYLMKTIDGGEHWQRQTLQGANVDARLLRIIFTPEGRGWTFGEGGAVYMSNDSGGRWTRVQVPARYVLFGGAFLDNENGFLVGAGSTILHTYDGGDTWITTRVPAGLNIHFNAISFADMRNGWAVGNNGAIVRTTNGGRSWTQLRSGVNVDLMDVKFFDAREGWAIGAEGTLLHTRDGGSHWQSEQSGTEHTLERLFFADRAHGWAVGFGGTIVSTTTRVDSLPKLGAQR